MPLTLAQIVNILTQTVNHYFCYVLWFQSVNGETLGLGLCYFLLRLTLVLTERFILGERLKNIQWLAVGIAVVAVASSLLRTGHFSGFALLVALGYPLYILLWRKHSLPVLSIFFIENLLLVPIAR